MRSQEMERKEYLTERKLLITLESNAYQSFDKTLLTLSSGAIALSVAFLDKLHYPFLVNFLILSWLCWFASIMAQLTSLYFSPKAMRDEQLILNEQYKDYSKDPRDNKYQGIPSALNLLSLVSFGLGAFLFIVFIISNFSCIIK